MSPLVDVLVGISDDEKVFASRREDLDYLVFGF